MSSTRAMGDPVWTFCGLLLLVAASCLPSTANAGLTVQTVFNQSGIQGTITFAQDQPDAATTISVDLMGLEQFNESYPWHVHEYPFPLGIKNPCRTEITGGHYDPLGANQGGNYTEDCARDRELCEIGDLSGKFGGLNASESVVTFTDPSLSLYGIYSIIGRSVVIHRQSGARLVCANIEYPASEFVEIVHTPFRRVFAGNMYFRQHTNDATSSVYVDLIRVDGIQNSTNHNWHVHESAVNTSDLTCSSAGPHYNPRGAPADQPIYSQICNSTAQENCEVGDLSNKGAPLNVSGGVSKFFYTDIDLPLLGEEISIVDRSVVIHAEGRGAPRISCANNSRFASLQAVAFFDEDGVSGSVRFFQDSPFDETRVTVTLSGLDARAAGYHVHVTPVGPGGSGSERCMVEFTGGHWNPLGVIYDENNLQITSDQFEIGDLSGKFGSLAGRDSISATFSDPNVPLSGVNGIIGRSIVVHYPNGSRWFCSNIVHVGPVIQHIVVLNMSNVSGQVTFIQPADSPFAETVIIIEAEIDVQFPEVTPSMSPIPFQSTPAAVQPSSVPFQAPTSVPVATTQPSPTAPQPSISAPTSLQFVSPSLLGPMTTTSTAVDMSSSATGVLQSSMDVLLLPLPSTTSNPSPTPSSQGRRKRAESAPGKGFARHRVRRQSSGTQGFGWSLRQLSSGEAAPTDCSSLPLYDPFMSSPTACSPATPLGCPSGDLTSKHGPFLMRAVFTDPNLPLSGPDSVFAAGGSAVLLLQPPPSTAGSVPAVCAQVELVPTPATPTAPPATTPTAPPATTPTAPPTDTPTAPPATTLSPADDGAPIGAIVGAVVGGLVGAILLLVIILCCLRYRGRDGYHVAKEGRERDKDTTVELGRVDKRMEPVFGVPRYRVLHDYSPQNEGDLTLTKGDWITLIEAPYGGEWWQGSVGDKEGWFPKSYVEYVDMQAEKKKLEEDNFKLAAVAIVVASSSFSAKHGSLAANRKEKVEPRTRRAYTFGKKDIDSTPKLVTKLGHTPGKEETPEGGVVIENLGIVRTGSNGTGPPGTPKSQRSAEIIMNPNAAYAALQGSPYATPTLGHKAQLTTTSPSVSSQDPDANAAYANVDSLAGDKYVAKYDFTGSTDIELPLKKGETVVVVERSESGWCQGISAGHMGWFPETYIKPAPVETPRVQPLVQPRRMSEMMAGEVEELEVSEFRALHPYQSSLVGDLTFPEGATVLVYWADDTGWWYGATSGEQGWFPGSYVEPIVEMSEGGSQLTSPVQGEGEERAPTPAARKPNEEQKKTKSSFKKKWSMKRRGSRKDSEKEAASHSEVEATTLIKEEPATNIDAIPSEPLASPRARLTSEEGLGLQEEITAALSSVFSPEGTSKKMSIDERVALMKERRASEQTAKEDELTAVLARRTSKTGSHEPQSPTAMAVQKEPEPHQEGDRREDSATPQERLEPEGSEAVVERSETPRKEAEGQGGEKEERKESVIERRETPAGESRETATTAKPSQKKPRTSVSAVGKPKRKAPPPPPGAVPVMPMSQRVESPVQPKKSTTATLPAHIKASPEVIPKSQTMTSGRSPSAGPKAQKRRTTTADQKAKPRRRPPPPPQAALAAVLRSNPLNKLEAVTEDTDSVFIDDARRGSAPLLEPAPALAAKGQFRKASEPARMRPRVQRVKRPLSRNIPPPPNIPLPPPPVRKIPRESSASQEPGKGVAQKTSLPKPAIKPKPAHLSEAILLKRKESETSIANKEPDRTMSPNIQEDGEPGAVPKRTPRGPKPPPPARTSSLSEQHAHLLEQQTPSLASISDFKEESEEESALVRSLPPSYPPPPRPVSVLSGKLDEPDGQAKPDKQVESGEIGKTRKKSDAPERPPPPRLSKSSQGSRESATQKSEEDLEGKNWGASLKRKGSSLMQSLKRMVRRSDSGKDVEVEADGEGARASISDDVEKSRPPKPSEPPPTLPSSTSLSPTLSEDAMHAESPVPKPRTKLPKQTSTEDSKQASKSTKSEAESKGKPKPVPLPRAAHSPSPDTPSSALESPKTPNNFFRAVKSYKAERSMELSFSAGDILIEVDRPDDKFIYGMLDDGNTGLFPITHVEPFYSPSS